MTNNVQESFGIKESIISDNSTHQINHLNKQIVKLHSKGQDNELNCPKKGVQFNIYSACKHAQRSYTKDQFSKDCPGQFTFPEKARFS